jgi:hypothetical protein
MPRPISGNQLDKLGKRLAQPGPISDEDYELLARVAQVYQAVADRVQERLRSLGFEPTTRGFKSTGTLVDKLRRTHLSLKDIQDLAGARIVIDGERLDQDRAVERIMRASQGCPKLPLLIDRRERPSYGYRAVHEMTVQAKAIIAAYYGSGARLSYFQHMSATQPSRRLGLTTSEAARHLVVVNDLLRSRAGLLLAHVATRLLTRSAVVHKDGPLSVHAAFTPAEVLSLAERAGLQGAKVSRRWPCRRHR